MSIPSETLPEGKGITWMTRFVCAASTAADPSKLTGGRGALCAVFAFLVLCMLTAFGCFPTYRRLSLDAYLEWYEDRRSDYDRLKEEARSRGWMMYVWNGNGIGRLDLGRASYQPLYTAPTGRRIWAASSYVSGRISLIECAEKNGARHTVSRSEFQLKILTDDGRISTVPLGATFSEGLAAGIVLGERSVVFASMSGEAYLYDMESCTVHEILRRGSPLITSGIYNVLLLEDRFLIVLTRSLLARELPGHAEGADMLVLDAKEPYRVLGTLDLVEQAGLVGENVVVEKVGECFLYDPGSGSLDLLTSGSLVGGLGRDRFLFCRLRQGSIRSGQGSLYQYSLSQRSAEPIWETGPSEWCGYLGIFPSPDSDFLFIPLVWDDPPVFPRVYVLFDLDSSESKGELFSPFEGEFHIHFLGWAEHGGASLRRTANRRTAATMPGGTP